MTSRFLPFAASICLAGSALLATPAALAQSANATEVSVARDQFRAGMDAARAGRWADALQNFTRSYELLPRPLTLLNLAGAQVQSGRLVQGAESYRRFLNEATDGPAAQHRAAAQSALDEVNARIPRARISADLAQPDDQFTMDGQRLPRAMIGIEVPVDPGTHVVLVMRDGVEVGRATFPATERGHHDVRIAVNPNAARAGTSGATGSNDRAGNASGGGQGSGSSGGTSSGAGASGGGGTGSGNAGADTQRTSAWTQSDEALSIRSSTARPSGGSPWPWVGLGVVLAAGAAVATIVVWTVTAPQPFTGNVGNGRFEIR